ncbi:P-loop containing nucleoside triphosphate hydrolase protein [Jackrogersella minutella]|nr:P-loop containing nucleoside triphosphate hydrolase protein [Jackrogersella minutella]
MVVKNRWLLASDLHFKLRDLDRVVRTADWITSIPSKYNVSRAILCGDLFTARTSQPTNVLAACYRFLSKLASTVPHMDIILGNHDLAYRSDYTTSALEALASARLAPFVTLHTQIACHKWDGRRVLVMPFREDQGEIIKYIRDLDPKIAAETVGFGHLAINRAITQKHTIDPETGKVGLPSRYPGLTSAGEFAPLAKTFTGHFHSHQTILQATNEEPQDLRGSITYIGAPLQLTWADLFDTRKGVILLDPQTLEFELVDNPHAAGYTSVEAQEVLADRVDVGQVQDKHAMITGKLTMAKFISARDRLVKLGVRSVRDWKHIASEWQFGQRGLGKTMLPADIQVQSDQEKEGVSEETGKTQRNLDRPLTVISQELTTDKMEREPLDPAELVHEYVSSLELESTLENRRDILSLVGKRLFYARGYVGDKAGCEVKYRDMLDPSPQHTLFIPAADVPQASTEETIFAAEPVAIEITNFLGVQGTLSLDFKFHFQPGINLIVGHNGAGKSTIIEAIVWCQFGQCIRGGLGVNDVVNDVAGKDCNVRLTFANGYTISRSRKHNTFRNRVVVEKNGAIQSQFEGPDAKSTQTSINSLLGVDFDTFIRIVLLGNESAPSFLSSTSLQKRQLIELVLGLGVLDGCAEACGSMLSQVEGELGGLQSQLDGVVHTIAHLESRVNQAKKTLRRLQIDVGYIAKDMKKKQDNPPGILSKKEFDKNKLQEELKAQQLLPDFKSDLLSLQSDISLSQDEVNRLSPLVNLAQARSLIDRRREDIKQEIIDAREQVDRIQNGLQLLLEENRTLEIPSSIAIEKVEENKREDTRSTRGFLLNIISTFRKFWTWVLDVVNPEVRNNARVMEENARRAMETKRQRVELEWNDHMKTIVFLAEAVKRTQSRVRSVSSSEARLFIDVASRTRISVSEVHNALQTLTVQEALKVRSQFTVAKDELRILTDRHAHLQLEHAKREQELLCKQLEVEKQEREIEIIRRGWADSLEQHRRRLDGKEREITIYKKLLESEVESSRKLDVQSVDLSNEVERIRSHREIFAFWQSALTRRQVAASRVTFRQHVIRRHLGELNKLLVQILMVMYQDAHYARSMITGALRTLFEEDDEADDDHDDDGEKTSVLESSLSIASTIGYSKKSGGERKRVDLALFFALFIMSEARSAHRARYMLVDEAFDGLDTAGQAAVLKLCHWMTERLAYVLVITHSQSFITLAEEQSSAASDIGASVITAKAGDKGTELQINGVCVSSSLEGTGAQNPSVQAA